MGLAKSWAYKCYIKSMTTCIVMNNDLLIAASSGDTPDDAASPRRSRAKEVIRDRILQQYFAKVILDPS